MVLAIAAASAARAANTIYLAVGPQWGSGPPNSNPYQYGDGGEFTALAPSLGVPAGYAADATLTLSGQTGFETFCVEDQVDFYVAGTYYFTEGLAIQQAGAIDELTVGVAWLYQQFATGELSEYDYSNAPASANDFTTRAVDAGQLQSAIWYLQNEPADGNVNFGQPDYYAQLAMTHFGGTLADAQVAVTSAAQFGVQVLELTSGPNGTGSVAQDQLVYTGVPDGAMTVSLFGMALLALAAVRRRFAS